MVMINPIMYGHSGTVAVSATQNFAWLASLAWIFFLIIAWEMVWKGIALWKSGKNKQLAWFVCIFIFNTVGILPLIYLIWFQKKSKSSSRTQVRRSSARGSSSRVRVSRSRSPGRRKRR